MAYKAEELVEEFKKYCMENPELRFWQALRNCSEFDFIYTGSNLVHDDINLHDTFYWKGKKS